jgi:hypothetical protein
MSGRREERRLYVERLPAAVLVVLAEAAQERRDDVMHALLEKGQGVIPKRWEEDARVAIVRLRRQVRCRS